MFWKKKQEPVKGYSIKELIATTVRNRLGKYHSDGLNIDNPDWIIQHLQEQYACWYEGEHLEKNVIDALVKICEEYEYKMRIGTQASIKEYGK